MVDEQGLCEMDDFEVLMCDDIKTLEGKYDLLIKEVISIRKKLGSLRDKEYALPYSKHKLISNIACLIGLLTYFLLVNLDFCILSQIISDLKILFAFTDTQVLFASVISMLVSIPLIGVLDVVVFKNIIVNLQLKSYQKIINSDEYKQLLKEIEKTDALLDEKLVLENKVSIKLLDCKSKQAINTADRNIRNVLSIYNKNLTEKMATDSDCKRNVRVRRLVNNSNNKGNIE